MKCLGGTSGLASMRFGFRVLALCAMVLVISAAAFIAPTPARAQTLPGSWVAYGHQGEYHYFNDPLSACQFAVTIPFSNAVFKYYEHDIRWDNASCHYTRAFLPDAQVDVNFFCPSGYEKIAPGVCQSLDLPLPDECPSNNGGSQSPSTPYPCDILTGAKRFNDSDFELAGSPLRLPRSYSSFGNSGVGFRILSPSQGLGNWVFDFAWELQIGGTFSSSGTVGVLRPGGTLYAFKKQTDGSLKPPTSPSPLPQTSVTVAFVGSWPSNLATLTQSSSSWTLTDEEGTVWTLQTLLSPSTGKFNIARPTSMVRTSGETLTFTYGVQTQLVTIADAYGNSITFDWIMGTKTSSNDIPLAISKAHLPGGETVSYVYDSATSPSRLESVEYRDAASVLKDKVSYDYGVANLSTWITGVRDKDGVLRWSVEYDNQGRATKSTGPSNAFAYSLCYGTFDAGGTCNESTGATIVRTVTNPLGKRFEYSFTRTSATTNDQKLTSIVAKDSTGTTGGTPASTRSLTYNSNKFIASSTDEEGRLTTFSRDALGFPTQIVEASGTAIARSTQIDWSTTVKQPTKIERSGQWRDERAFNTAGQLTTRTLTDLRTATLPYPTYGNQRIWSYSWSTAGKLLSVDGPLAGTSDTTTYTYNANGYLATVTDPVGLVTTATAWNGRGQPTSVTDPNGVVTTYAYDIMGRVTAITRDSAGTPATWTIEYDAVGNVDKLTQPSGSYLQYAYDDASRLLSVTNGSGETQSYTSNDNGNVTATAKSQSATVAFQQQAVFDDLGRQIQLITGASQTFTSTWDKSGLQLTDKDPRNGMVSYGWDALLRLITQTNEDGGVEGQTYDSADYLTNYSDPRSLSTALVNDGFGDVLQETSPDRGVLVYEYDARGLRTKRTDARGIVTNYSYDAAGRLTGISFPVATAENVTFTWDSIAGGNKGKGRLTGMTDRSGSTAWKYDGRGHITIETRSLLTQSFTTSYSWDANNRLAQMVYPSGRVVAFGYDGLDRPNRVTTRKTAADPEQVIIDTAYRAPFGPVRALNYGNGLADAWTLDQAYRPTLYELKNGATTLEKRLYAYADGLNLSAIDDDLDNSRDLTLPLYDAANRLKQAGFTESGTATTYAWSYDLVGNRTAESVTPSGGSATTRSYTYPATSNRLATLTTGGSTVRSLGYDAAGNTTGDTASATARTFTYDSDGNLVTASTGGVLNGSYAYDGMSRLAVRTISNMTPSGTTGFVYSLGGGGLFDRLMPGIGDELGDLGNRPIAEVDATGASLREYIWLGDETVGVVSGASTATPTLYFVHSDHLGRPYALTDSSKAFVWRATYKPFGEPLAITGSVILDQRFPGQWFQLESGLAWNWHRHYDASLGRYVQPDPLGFAAGPSLYGYVEQSPLMGVDPEGLDLADNILGWLGPGSICIRTPSGALQIMSADRSRLIRFDITSSTSHGLGPHINIEPGRIHIFLGN